MHITGEQAAPRFYPEPLLLLETRAAAAAVQILMSIMWLMKDRSLTYI